MKEIDAHVGQREFDDGSGNRNFVACVEYYNRQWAHAVKKKILTPSLPLRRAQAGANTRAETYQLSRVFEVKASLEQLPLPSPGEGPAYLLPRYPSTAMT